MLVETVEAMDAAAGRESGSSGGWCKRTKNNWMGRPFLTSTHTPLAIRLRTSYFVLSQADPGRPLNLDPNGPGQSMVDWGSFGIRNDAPAGAKGLDLLGGSLSRGLSMARTLGSEDANQVAKPGRRVLIGWTGPADGPSFRGQGSAQGLPRELSLGSDKALLQRFVPELKALRTNAHSSAVGVSYDAGLQTEVYATFPATACGWVFSTLSCFFVNVIHDLTSFKTALFNDNATVQQWRISVLCLGAR